MQKLAKALGFFTVLILALYFVLRSPADEKVVQSLEDLFPRLEKMGVTGFRNQDWCQVLALNGQAFANTEVSTCNFVTTLPTRKFTPVATEKFEEVVRILSDAKLNVLAISSIQVTNGKFDGAVFHKNCFFCRTRYVFQPGYGSAPEDVPNEIWHTPINQNWYRVEEDWN